MSFINLSLACLASSPPSPAPPALSALQCLSSTFLWPALLLLHRHQLPRLCQPFNVFHQPFFGLPCFFSTVTSSPGFVSPSMSFINLSLACLASSPPSPAPP